MIRVIGTHGCGRCQMVKNILQSKNIDFCYENFNDVTDKDFVESIIDKYNISSFPIILKNEEYISDVTKI